MRFAHLATAALAAVMVLAGCSGGQGSSAMPGVPGRTSQRSGTAVFVIDAPAQPATPSSRGGGSTSLAPSARSAHHDAAGVRPEYLSPATASISIAITGPTNVNETANLTVNSSGCTSTLASTICTLTVPGLAPCTSPPTNCYTATLTTYDQTAGTGNVLSAGQNVLFTITAGQSNTIDLTLSGVPVSTVVIPVGAFTVSNGGVYDLIGLGAHKFVVETLDADGNIIAGPGAPTFTFGTLSGLGVTLTQPTPTSPNEFSMTPPQTYSASTGSFTVTPTFTGQQTNGCTQTGANCSAVTVTADMKQMLAVANNGSIPGNIALYELGATSPFATITSGINNPVHLAADAAGDLFLVNWNTVTTSNVLEFAAAGTSLTNTISTGGAYPDGLAVEGPGQHLGIITCSSGTNSNGSACGGSASDSFEIVASPYSGTPTTITSGIGSPGSVAADSSGNFYVANCLSCATPPGGDTIAEFTSAGSLKYTYQLADACPCPSLFVDPSLNVFVIDTVVPDVQEFAQGSTVTPAETITSGVGASSSKPLALAGNSGNLFLANYLATGGSVVVYDGEGTIASKTITSGVSGADALAFDAAGDLYVSNIGLSPGVKEYAGAGTTLTSTLTTGVSNPQAIVIVP